MTYARIESAADLPPAGPLNARAREKADLDFKTFADPAKSWEHAKDIAAFSNALGGVLLVGADDSTGQLTYPGIAGQTVKDIQAIYEGAAQLCSPSPVVDVIPIPERNVVTVNVEPYLDQLVAAPAKSRDRAGKEIKHDAAWVFPIRRASQTEFIKPENLAMYMNREVRRAVLLLAKIPSEKKKGVRVSHHVKVFRGDPSDRSGPFEVETLELTLGSVSVERNFVALVDHVGHGTVLTCHVPLTDIIDVWQSENEQWNVLVRGALTETQTEHGTSLLNYEVHSRL